MGESTVPRSRGARTQRARLGLLSAILYVSVGLIALRVRNGMTPLRFDRQASHIVGSARFGKLAKRADVVAPWPKGMTRVLIAYGLPLGAITVVLGLALMAWFRRDLKAFVLCLVGPALAVLITDVVLKPLVDRHLGRSLAYPSGHATGAAAVAALVVILLHRWRGWRATILLGPLTLVLPAATGVALVRLAFHYPTDVVGGTAMGVATLVALAIALDVQQANLTPATNRRTSAGPPADAPGSESGTRPSLRHSA